MKIKYYQAYKDSGIEWLGDVPEHWNVTAVTNITTTVSIKNYPDEELLSVYREYGVIRKNTRDDNHNKAGQNLENYKLVEPGYLVINKMKAWQGSLGVSEFRGIVSPAYITCKTDKRIVERGYLHHLLRCRAYINEYNRLSYGVRVDQWDMRYDDFKYIPVLLPPLAEQKAIAHYLDTKTAQIDRKIDLLTQKATLYGNLKQSLINETVTRGLDKTVVMRDSRIEWIDEVPEHWGIYHLKNSVSVKITDGPHETPIFTNDGVPFISAEAIQNGGINFDSKRGYISEEKDKTYALKCKPKRDDIFIVKSGSTTGKTGYVSTDINFNIWSPLALVRAKKINYSRYLFYFLSSSFFQKQVQMYWSFGTQPNIGMKVLENLQVITPPFPEQKLIADYLDTKIIQIDQIIETINAQIEKLKELRKTLINDVVTGKIKVV